MFFKEAQGAAKRMRMMEIQKHKKYLIKKEKEKEKKAIIQRQKTLTNEINTNKIDFWKILNLQRWLRDRYKFLKKVKFLQKNIKRFLCLKKISNIVGKLKKMQI